MTRVPHRTLASDFVCLVVPDRLKRRVFGMHPENPE